MSVDDRPVPGVWPTDLLDCHKPDICFCIQTFLCPCMQYGANAQLLSTKSPKDAPCSGSYFYNCLYYFCVCYALPMFGCPPCCCCIHAPVRQSIMRLNMIDSGNGCGESFVVFFLGPCALIQEYNLLKVLPDHGAVGMYHQQAMQSANRRHMGGNVRIAHATPIHTVAQASFPNHSSVVPYPFVQHDIVIPNGYAQVAVYPQQQPIICSNPDINQGYYVQNQQQQQIYPYAQPQFQ